jgi:hypothetical protein
MIFRSESVHLPTIILADRRLVVNQMGSVKQKVTGFQQVAFPGGPRQTTCRNYTKDDDFNNTGSRLDEVVADH